jgi:hypothetical protein
MMATMQSMAAMFVGALLGVSAGPGRPPAERMPTITVLPDLPTVPNIRELLRCVREALASPIVLGSRTAILLVNDPSILPSHRADISPPGR